MIKRTIKQFKYLFLLSIFLTVGCDKSIIYSEFIKIPDETWSSGNVTVFSPEITDTTTLNNIFITLRSDVEYPFQNIWLFITTKSPSGKKITDTVEYLLADAHGRRYGRGFGNLRETDLRFREKIFFPEKGIYTFTIRHGMRTTDLKGIHDVGLRIEKTGMVKN